MAQEDHAFGFAFLGQHYLAGQADGVPVGVYAGVGTGYFDYSVLVVVAHQFLQHVGSRGTIRPADDASLFIRLGVTGVFGYRRSIGQVTVIGQTVCQIRLMLGIYPEGSMLGGFIIHEIYELLFLEAAGRET